MLCQNPAFDVLDTIGRPRIARYLRRRASIHFKARTGVPARRHKMRNKLNNNFTRDRLARRKPGPLRCNALRRRKITAFLVFMACVFGLGKMRVMREYL